MLRVEADLALLAVAEEDGPDTAAVLVALMAATVAATAGAGAVAVETEPPLSPPTLAGTTST